MTSTHRAGSYRTVLARPGVRRPMTLAALGRLGYAMLPLLLLFTIRDATGSFATAATAMAAFGLTTFTMPARGRLIDRVGQARSLTAMAVAAGIPLVTMSMAALGDWPIPRPAWVAATVVAGFAAPLLGPAARAQWRVIAPDDLDTVYAFDATLEETLWLAGPALAGAALTVVSPAAALLAVPAMLFVGSFGLASSRWRPPHDAPVGPSEEELDRDAGAPGAWWSTLTPVLFTMGGVGLTGSMLLTAVAAVAASRGAPQEAAAAEVAIGLGGVGGGLAWGASKLTFAARHATTVLLLVWAVAAALVGVLAPQPQALLPLVVAGATSAPLWVIAYRRADDAVPAARRTEASTWVTTASNLGSAAGTALVGWLSTLGSSGLSDGSMFVAAATVAGGTAALTALWWRMTPDPQE